MLVAIMKLKRAQWLPIILGAMCLLVAGMRADDEMEGQLIRITDLRDHCSETVCADFNYGRLNEYAIFDVKTEVRISNASSYDIIQPLNYESLVFADSSFANFPLNLFSTFKIRELDMRNCSIQRLNGTAFLMATNLQTMLLSDNLLTALDDYSFLHANKLQFLFLNANNISTLGSATFFGIADLRYLDLSDNRLVQLPDGLLDTLPRLTDLKLANNRLQSIDNNLLDNIENLRSVDLAWNDLRQIGEYAFAKQLKLVVLNVSHNPYLGALVLNVTTSFLLAFNCSLYRVNVYGRVRNVDMRDNQILELYFSEPEAIETLNLRNNALQQIASLARATNLRELDLSDNPSMRSLPAHWLSSSLERLHISNTSISTLPSPAFDDEAPVKLKFLNASHNKLTHIKPHDIRYLQQLTHFYIHNNDWNCFNLRILMDMLIMPHRITFKSDAYDIHFPGEYVNGVACMYRSDEPELLPAESDSGTNADAVGRQMHMPGDQLIRMQLMREQSSHLQELESELRVVTSFLQERLKEAFSRIDELSVRLAKFEHWNSTLWDHVTIST